MSYKKLNYKKIKRIELNTKNKIVWRHYRFIMFYVEH